MSAAEAALSALAAGRVDADVIGAIRACARNGGSGGRGGKRGKDDASFVVLAKLAGAVTRALAALAVDDARAEALADAGVVVLEAIEAARGDRTGLDPEKMAYNYMLRLVEKQMHARALATSQQLGRMLLSAAAKKEPAGTEYYVLCMGAALNAGACLESVGNGSSVARFIESDAPACLAHLHALAAGDAAAGARQADATYRVLYRLSARAESLAGCGPSVALEARRMALVALSQAKYDPKEFADLACKCVARHVACVAAPSEQRGDIALAAFAASIVQVMSDRHAAATPPPGSLSALGRVCEAVGAALVRAGMFADAASAYGPWEAAARKVACEHAAATAAMSALCVADGSARMSPSVLAGRIAAYTRAAQAVLDASTPNAGHVRRAVDASDSLRRTLSRVAGGQDAAAALGDADAARACEAALAVLAGLAQLAVRLAESASSDALRAEDVPRFVACAVQSRVAAAQLSFGTATVSQSPGAGMSSLARCSALLNGRPADAHTADLWKIVSAAAYNWGADRHAKGMHDAAAEALRVAVAAAEACASIAPADAPSLQLPRRCSLLASCLGKLGRGDEAAAELARAFKWLSAGDVAGPSALAVALIDQSVRLDAAGDGLCLSSAWAAAESSLDRDALLRLYEAEMAALHAHARVASPRHRQLVDVVMAATADVDAAEPPPEPKGKGRKGVRTAESRVKEAVPSSVVVARARAVTERGAILLHEGNSKEALAACDLALSLADRVTTGESACATCAAAMYAALASAETGASPLKYLRRSLEVLQSAAKGTISMEMCADVRAACVERSLALADYFDSANMDSACADALWCARVLRDAGDATTAVREAWARLRSGDVEQCRTLTEAAGESDAVLAFEAKAVHSLASLAEMADRPPTLDARGGSRTHAGMREAGRALHAIACLEHAGLRPLGGDDGLAAAGEALALRKSLARVDLNANAAAPQRTQWLDLAAFLRSLALAGRIHELRGLPRDAAYYYSHGRTVAESCRRALAAAEFTLLLAGVDARRGRRDECERGIADAREMLAPFVEDGAWKGCAAVARLSARLSARCADFDRIFGGGEAKAPQRGDDSFAEAHRAALAQLAGNCAGGALECAERAIASARLPHEHALAWLSVARACAASITAKPDAPAEVCEAPSVKGSRGRAAQTKKGTRAQKAAPQPARDDDLEGRCADALSRALSIARSRALRVVQRQACMALASRAARTRRPTEAAAFLSEGLGCALRTHMRDVSRAPSTDIASMMASLSLSAPSSADGRENVSSFVDAADGFDIVLLAAGEDGRVLVARIEPSRRGGAVVGVGGADGTPPPLAACLAEFASIMAESQRSMAAVSGGVPDNDTKARWWKDRVALDARMRALVGDMESRVLGWTKILLPGEREGGTAAVEKAAQSALSALSAHGIDDSALGALCRVVDAGSSLSDDELARFAKECLGLGEEDAAKAVDELRGAQLCDNAQSERPTDPEQGKGRGRRGARGQVDPARTQPCTLRRPTVLVLDGTLQALPWESMPCLRACAVTRVPSIDCIARAAGGLRGPPAWPVFRSPSPGAFVLNPGGDLKATQETFEEPLCSQKGWTGVVGRRPSEDEFKGMLANSDVFVYCGHGAGDDIVPPDAIARAHCRAAALLVGCSSGRLRDAGEYEPTGTPHAYLAAGSPAIVANLWDVTDRDIDRFSARVVAAWMGIHCAVPDKAAGEHVMRREAAGATDASDGVNVAQSGAGAGAGRGTARAPATECLARCVADARDACKLPYLIGAAPVVYGLPVRARR